MAVGLAVELNHMFGEKSEHARNCREAKKCMTSVIQDHSESFFADITDCNVTFEHYQLS